MYQKELWDIKKLVENYPVLTTWGVRHLLRHRKIPFVRFTSNGRIYFDPQEIARWIEEHKVKESM